MFSREQLCYVNFFNDMNEGSLLGIDWVFMDEAGLSVDGFMPCKVQRLLFESKIDEDLA